MSWEKNHYVADMVSPFVASFTESSVGLEANRDLTRISVQYVDIITKMLVHHREMQWVERELSKLQSETEEFKSFF